MLGPILFFSAITCGSCIILYLFFVDFVIGTTSGRVFFGTSLGIATYFLLRGKAKNSEGWQMTIAFIKAKKEHFCPIVEFK
jgi:hypothetical protein